VSEDLIGKRVEYLAEFDMDDSGTEKEPRWCSGVVERICDGTWVIPGRMRKCWKENEAVEVFWDAIPEADAPACRAQVALDPKNGIMMSLVHGGWIWVNIIMVFNDRKE